MINKMAGQASAILLLICSHEVWVKVTYDWSTALCLCLSSCRPSFHESKLRHKHEHKHKKNDIVRIFVLMLMLVSTQFSLAYTCACACASAYALVKTRLNSISTVPCKRVAQEEFVRLKSRVDRCNRGLK